MPNQFPLPTPSTDFVSPPPTQGSPLPPPPIEVPPTPPNYTPPEPVTKPPVTSSPFKFVVPAIIGLVVVGIVVFVASKLLGGSSAATDTTTSSTKAPEKAITLNYWGLWETPAIMKPVIEAFESANPGIKVNYQQQSYQDYQDRLMTNITGTNPPDVARIHATWLPIFIKNLLPAPANTISVTELQTNFYSIAASSVIAGNQVYGVPVNTDGLVLFVNNNILKQKNLQVPTTWEDLTTAAKALTERDPATGKITRAGVALGNTSNVAHWADIVSLMMMQAGVNLLAPNSKSVGEVLSFYTSFAAPGSYWDETLPNSIPAFANEKVAMIFAPLWRIGEIQTTNPNLSWQAVKVPQLPAVEPTNWASMWVEIVPKTSSHPQEAWKFVSYLASAKAQQLLFETALKERGSAQVPTNKAAASAVVSNPVAGALIGSLTSAKTFYTASDTRDSSTGLNSRLIKYLEDAVNATTKRQESSKIIETLSLGFNQVLSQYRLVNPLPTPTP